MRPEKNNFKLLAEEDIKRYPQAPPRVERHVQGTMGFLRMVSQVVELYLPRVFDIVVTMVGGEQPMPDKRNPRRDPAGRGGSLRS